MNVQDLSGRLIGRKLRLSEFKFEIRYMKGISNAQVDALSRLTTNGGTILDAYKENILCLNMEVDDHNVPTLELEGD